MDIRSLIELKKNPNVADFRPGDAVRVHARVVEGDRERIQAFEGVVIRVRRGGINSNFTVRRISHGVGVERTFPLYSPLLEKVEVVRVGRVRRAKLYYLRQRRGKAARIKAGRRRPEWAAAAVVEAAEEEEAELEEPLTEEEEAEEEAEVQEAEVEEAEQPQASGEAEEENASPEIEAFAEQSEASEKAD